MAEVNWARSLPKVIMELQTNNPAGVRYWIARTLPTLEAEQ
jgi:hypothetical protein